jgi:hypothetical protein
MTVSVMPDPVFWQHVELSTDDSHLAPPGELSCKEGRLLYHVALLLEINAMGMAPKV